MRRRDNRDARAACRKHSTVERAPVSGQALPVLDVRCQGACWERSAAAGFCSDISDPYWYLRIDEERGERHAIFGGADHKTGQTRATEPCFEAVEHALAAIIPSARIERRWSGQVIETNNGLPYIGATGDHQFVATGYAGNGLTFGTLAGMILHDGVMGLSNPWRAMFDPNRKTLSARALTKLVGENIDYPYYFVADRLRRDPKQRVQDIKPGEGKVLTIDDRRVACTSDPRRPPGQGERSLHAFRVSRPVE